MVLNWYNSRESVSALVMSVEQACQRAGPRAFFLGPRSFPWRIFNHLVVRDSRVHENQIKREVNKSAEDRWNTEHGDAFGNERGQH